MIDDIVTFFRANSNNAFVAIEPHAYPFVEYRQLEKVNVNSLYCYGGPECSEWLRQSLREDQVLIGIEEWLQGQDYRQLREFVDNAGFNFVLRTEGQPQIVISQNNFAGTRSSRGGDHAFQGFYIQLNKDQIKMLAQGIPYTLHPKNKSEKYLWQVNENIALIMPYKDEDKVQKALNDSIAAKVEMTAGLQAAVQSLNALECSVDIGGTRQRIDFRIQAAPNDIAAASDI